MRAIMVCVEYGDILSITLPYNRHHFDEVLIVTTADDDETIEVAKQNKAGLFFTQSFYEDGAIFNKWRALEDGLRVLGRMGLLCIMDADVLWPKIVGDHSQFLRNRLYTPRRRVWKNIRLPFPPEHQWGQVAVFPEREWAGYTQIFHADDKHLPVPPWHQTDWIHAGGADSFFQDLWPSQCKIRPEWTVLHLGPPRTNWCGRTSIRADGTLPEDYEYRRNRLQQLLASRRLQGYAGERLQAPTGPHKPRTAPRG